MGNAVKTSAIGWTDFSGGDLNFVTGCTPVSEGCANCYARRIYERFGRDFSQVTFHEDKLRRLWWKEFPQYSPKRGAPHKPMAFVVDTGDLFHERVWSDEMWWAFDVFARRQDVIWQVLTKRPERMLREVQGWCQSKHIETLPANVWLGVSAENQKRADERIPLLLETPASARFISVEPMLEAVRLRPEWLADVDWTICGAESGPNRRGFDRCWAFDLYQQCRYEGIPFFYKQGSHLRPGQDTSLPRYGVVQEWPEDALKAGGSDGNVGA